MSAKRPVRRILLVRLSHLGDVLHGLPVFHALRAAYPEARIAWAVQREYVDMLAPIPGLTRIIPFDRRGGWRAWRSLWKDLRSFQPDWTLDVQGNWKSAGVTFLSRAPRRTGFHKSDRREQSSAWVTNDPAPPWAKMGQQHAIDRSLHLAAHACNITPQEVTKRLPEDWLQVSAVERTTGRKRWRERMGEAPHRPVIVQLAAPGDVRAWPVPHQIALLRELHDQGRDVMALSGPGESDLGATIAEQLGDLPRLHHWVGQRSLRELAGAMRAAAQTGAVLVSCDSGPLHMGAICGLPVIGLAGPQDAARTGPWPVPGPGSTHQALRANGELDCAPCLSRRCERADGAQCMEQLSVQQVLDALELPAQATPRP